MNALPSIGLGAISRPKQWPVLSKSQMSKAGYPVYGANGRIGFADEFTHERPTLLIGCRGSCGSVHVTEPRSYANGNAMALDDLDEDRVDLRFLYWFLLYRGFDDVITGSSQPQIIRQNLVRVEVPLLPLAEQRRIAAILDQADALRAKRRAALAQLDEMARAIFVEMFGDPTTNPKGWPLRSVDDVCARLTVGYVSSMTDEYLPAGIPLLRSLNVRRNILDLTDLKFISPDFHREIRKSALRPGDVVTVRTGRPGTTAVIPVELAEANCADLIVMTCGPRVRPTYLSEYLNQRLGDADHIQGIVGAVQAHFNIGAMRRLGIPCPPIGLQDEFETRLAALDGAFAKQQSHRIELDALFTCLQHRAFRGEL